MYKHILGVLGFLVILSVYVTLLVVLARVLHILFLAALLAWLLVRRPMMYPERASPDIKAFADWVGASVRTLIGVLVQPLVNAI